MPGSDLASQMSAFQQCILDRDVVAAEAVLDDDYTLVLVWPSPTRVTRAEWLAMLPDYVVHQYDVEEQVIDEDGDVAAVMHRATMGASVLGQDRSGRLIVSDVWRRRPGGWRVWRRNSTPLSAAPMPAADDK